MDARSKLSASIPANGTHTPGPWVVVRDTGLRRRIQTSGDKGTLAYMTARPFSYGSNFSHNQIAANANLIAAAPDLLEACEEALNALIGCAVSAGGVDDSKHLLDARATLRKAINKANDNEG